MLNLHTTNNTWLHICYHRTEQYDGWNKRAAAVACRELQFLGGWPVSYNITDQAGTDLEQAYYCGFDCRSGKKIYLVLKFEVGYFTSEDYKGNRNDLLTLVQSECPKAKHYAKYSESGVATQCFCKILHTNHGPVTYYTYFGESKGLTLSRN